MKKMNWQLLGKAAKLAWRDHVRWIANELPLWCAAIGAFVGGFFSSSDTIPMWSWLNVLTTTLGAVIITGGWALYRMMCRRLVKRYDAEVQS